MKKLLFVFLAIITVGFSYKIYIIINAGLFRSTEKIEENIAWKRLIGTQRVQDLQISKDQQTLFFSHSINDTKGAISKVILPNDSTPVPLVIDLKYQYSNSFNPKGISLWEGDNGRQRLFVINHFDHQYRVDIFNIKNDSLLPIHSIKSSKYISLNDIVATSPNSFYLSNDKGSKEGLSLLMENFFQLPSANIIYYDGESFTEVLNRLAYCSGLAYDPKSHTLYIAETLAQKIYCFETYGNEGFLKETGSIRLPNPEKINLDHNGNLWVTCHPELNSLIQVKENPEILSATQIIKLTPTYKGQFYKKVIYSHPSPATYPIVTAARKGEIWTGSLSHNGIKYSQY